MKSFVITLKKYYQEYRELILEMLKQFYWERLKQHNWKGTMDRKLKYWKKIDLHFYEISKANFLIVEFISIKKVVKLINFD